MQNYFLYTRCTTLYIKNYLKGRVQCTKHTYGLLFLINFIFHQLIRKLKLITKYALSVFFSNKKIIILLCLTQISNVFIDSNPGCEVTPGGRNQCSTADYYVSKLKHTFHRILADSMPRKLVDRAGEEIINQRIISVEQYFASIKNFLGFNSSTLYRQPTRHDDG